MVEILWVIVLKLSVFTAIVSILAGVVAVIFIAFFFCGDGYVQQADKDKAATRQNFKVVLIITALTAPLAVIPTPEELFKIRLGMLKYTMASPENVQKGMDEIQRVAAKLECKYLGCKEEAKHDTSN